MQVIIVDANELTRSGLEMLLSSSEIPLKVIGSFEDVGNCEQFLKERRVNMILMDI